MKALQLAFCCLMLCLLTACRQYPRQIPPPSAAVDTIEQPGLAKSEIKPEDRSSMTARLDTGVYLLLQAIDSAPGIIYLPIQLKDSILSSIAAAPGSASWKKAIGKGHRLIPSLIRVLDDGRASGTFDRCEKTGLTYGQLAFELIDEIEGIPFFLVFQQQFDVFKAGSCHPAGLMDYVRDRGGEVRRKYLRYYQSKEHADWIRDHR